MIFDFFICFLSTHNSQSWSSFIRNLDAIAYKFLRSKLTQLKQPNCTHHCYFSIFSKGEVALFHFLCQRGCWHGCQKSCHLQCHPGEQDYLGSLSSASKLVSIPLQCQAGVSPQASWSFTDNLLCMGIYPVLHSLGFFFPNA